ncbi:MAG: hypothetical protein WKF86_00050 [Acidimicrobiales bacterium]
MRRLSSLSPQPAELPRSLPPSAAIGVGRSRTAMASGVPNPLPFRPRSFTSARLACHWSKSSPSFELDASGVGRRCEDEHSFPAVGSTNVGCSNARPRRVVPDLGQVPENSSEAQGTVPCDVLQDDEPGS